MWNSHRSLVLSKVCVVVFLFAVGAVLLFSTHVLGWLFRFSEGVNAKNIPFFYITLYLGGAMALVLLGFLYRLLWNIGKNKVFVRENTKLMRSISWLCFSGGLVAFISGFYYLPWFLVAVAAAFVGLVLRVLKNVWAQAIILKEENDYTI